MNNAQKTFIIILVMELRVCTALDNGRMVGK